MATADSVKANLQSIIAKANSTTGRADNNVDSAVDALISGFGQGGITPSGTKTITANGTHDVTNYASAQVNVPVGITPSGTKTITENGTHDVTAYASALVNIPVPAEKMVVLPITVSADLGAGTNKNQSIVTGNDFVKQHYADNGFAGIFIPVSGESIDAASGVVTFVYHGNRPLIKTSNTYYGCFTKSNGTSSAPAVQPNNYKINAKGYNVSLRVESSGNVNLYVASNFTVKAGNYLLVLLCTD